MAVFPEHKPIKFGRYVLLDRINVGGMAEVFRGKDAGVEGFERMVALKRILPQVAADPEFVEMFVDEAKLAVQLQHANIAQIHDLGKVDGQYYMAMEYVSGVDLRTMWDRARQRNRLLPIAMSCHIMQKVCEGLDSAHRKKDQDGKAIGLVHRDISPHNILVSFEGETKVIDFGIARAANKVSKTQAGVLKGKFGYMSPEQVRGVDLDNRSDVFACGIVLYELLVGDRLFLGESDFSTLEKVRNVEFVPPTRLNKQLSPHLERIVMKALAKRREDRYRWASEMAEDLQRYLFSSDQPFARTDLQRYMQQQFRQEITKEQERLERYRSIHFDDIAGDAAVPARISSRPESPAPATETARASSGGRGQTAVEAPPAAPALGAEEEVGEPAPPPRAPPEKAGVPLWAAAMIGVLSVLIVVTAGVLFYVANKEPEPGSITIQTVPAHAEILLNDKVMANTSPLSLDNLQPATYILTVRAEGYEKVIRAIRIAPGEARLEAITLERRAGKAALVLRTDPPGLAVWIDGENTGRVTPATVPGLEAGARKVMLKRVDGSIVHRFQQGLEENGTATMEIDTRTLPALLDLSSEPQGAQARVNGRYKGTTPVTVSGLHPGDVNVELSVEGCTPAEEKVEVRAATIVPVHVKLSCAQAPALGTPTDRIVPMGRLNVTATAVADVFIDGEIVGRTPTMGIPVPEGRRVVRLVPIAGDKAAFETEVMIAANAVEDLHHRF